jgi:ACT domain-containing protein
MEKEESKMIEKDGFIIFALKESEYLKEYYENLIIGKIIRGNIKITDLNIVKSYKKDMYALQTKGFVLNQSQIIIESRLESVIEEIGIEHPKFVLKKLDS